MDDTGVISAINTISSLQGLLLPSLRDAQGSKRFNIGCVFQRGMIIKMAADIGLARSSNGHHWTKALRLRLQSNKARRRSLRFLRRKSMAASTRRRSVRRLHKQRKAIKLEKDGVYRKVKALKRLVPGGRAMDLERLFDETADYIMALRGQVTAMKALASIFESKNCERKTKDLY